MTFEEVLDLPKNAPILLADGKFGLVIRWAEPDEIGVQVAEEEDVRWVKVSCVTDLGGGALMEEG